MKLRSSILVASLTGIVSCLTGCASDKDAVSQPGGAPLFESDSPNGSKSASRGDATVGMGGASAAAPSADSGSNGEAARTIEEADIVKVEGSRIYALSQYGGLNIIDVTDKDHLKILGRKKVQAQPFEMYVRDSIVFALYNGFGQYVAGPKDGEWNYVTTSYVMAFDTSAPSDPKIIGRFSVPGNISDSRIVGNILYVVGFEGSGCWDCQAGQHTTVISLDVSVPSAIKKVDQISYADDTTTQYSWKRSISVNDKRMYVAGPEWGTSGPLGSTIQVVDISDPKGDLVEGTTVNVEGSVNSRWQMDEFDGTLRVISQPGEWRPTDTVKVQTFKVNSAQSLTKLGYLAMNIPPNETLRSVRFDGTRGYAVTAVQTDPLFTLDLSDPAQPRQGGEIVMPGWVYHMEPRGNRVLGLGYDQGNPAGALAISLFDVADLNAPKLLDRVNFGGTWSWINEGQDQVHKAFQVLDASNLILMPFSGWVESTDGCSSSSVNGIQLVDWANDGLNLRGVASLVGNPRRGFLKDDRLYAMSDERIENFDIANRSAPLKKATVKLAQQVESTVAAGNTIVKVAHDWYSGVVSLDTTTLGQVESPEELGHLDLGLEANKCSGGSYLGSVVAGSNKVYVVVNEYHYDSVTYQSSTTSRLLTVDVSNAASPKVVGEATLDFGEGWSYWGGANLVSTGKQSAAVGDALVMLSTKSVVDALGNYTGTETVAHVIDMSVPSKPKISSLQVGSTQGTTGLVVDGTTVGVGYYTPSPVNASKVRFYVDRIDVSDAARPKLLPAINVPGSLVAFDSKTDNAITVDYKELTATNITAEDCASKYSSGWFEYPNGIYVEGAKGTCHSMQQTVNLVSMGLGYGKLLGSEALPIGKTVSTIAAGDDRLFMTLGQGYYGYYAMDSGMAGGATADIACMGVGCGYYGYSTFNEAPLPLVVVSGMGQGKLSTGTLNLAGGDYWGYAPIAASGKRVVLSTGWRGNLAVVDGANVEAPVLVRQAEVAGTTQHLTIAGGVGIASLYYDGVQTIRVSD